MFEAKTNLPHNDDPLSLQLRVICPLGRMETETDELSPHASLQPSHLQKHSVVKYLFS